MSLAEYILACTMFFECSTHEWEIRHEASVIYNLSADAEQDLVEIVSIPEKFSSWNGKVMPTHVPEQIALGKTTPDGDNIPSWKRWRMCVVVAQALEAGEFTPVTEARVVDWDRSVPAQARNMYGKPVGRQIFYLPSKEQLEIELAREARREEYLALNK